MMGIQVNINSITGETPYYIFICSSDGSECVYIGETDILPFSFEIPKPYDNQTEYRIKIYDGFGFIITDNKEVSV